MPMAGLDSLFPVNEVLPPPILAGGVQVGIFTYNKIFYKI